MYLKSTVKWITVKLIDISCYGQFLVYALPLLASGSLCIIYSFIVSD